VDQVGEKINTETLIGNNQKSSYMVFSCLKKKSIKKRSRFYEEMGIHKNSS